MIAPDPTFEDLLRQAAAAGASDVHLKAGGAIIFRVHRELQPFGDDAPSEAWLRSVLSGIAPAPLLADYEQGREIDFAFVIENLGRFRTNAFQQRGQTALAIRLVKSEIRTFAELNLPAALQQVAQSKRGIIIVAGAIGSGKSTTLAAMIDHVNRHARKHVITLEDPIEYLFEDRQSVIEQREVGLDTETFSTGLRHILRQDPDIIMIGEMRDAESAMAAMSAANIGHLVVTTLHTSDAMQSIQRVVEFFPSEQRDYARNLFAATLRAVVCQRLVPSAKTGIVPAVEILLNNVSVTKAIEGNQTDKLPGIMQLNGNEGMQTFDQALRGLVDAGTITRAEAMAQAANPETLRMAFQGVTLNDSNRILGSRR